LPARIASLDPQTDAHDPPRDVAAVLAALPPRSRDELAMSPSLALMVCPGKIGPILKRVLRDVRKG